MKNIGTLGILIGIYGQADASKVKVVGPGINHGVLKKYKSTFVEEKSYEQY